jgi:hypothetical protein
MYIVHEVVHDVVYIFKKIDFSGLFAANRRKINLKLHWTLRQALQLINHCQ